MKFELLIATNGFQGTWRAVEYGAWFAQSMRMKVNLLGVAEKSMMEIDEHHPLENIFADAVELFQKAGVEYNLEIRNGEAEQVISARQMRAIL